MTARRTLALAAVAASVAALAGYAALDGRRYQLLSFVLAALALLPPLIRFESRKPHARRLVLLAALAALGAVGRIPFAMIPSVQPTTFVVIVSGMAFGAESGFMVGVLAAVVSDLFLGLGPWTPWQMLAWGLAGFSSGMLRRLPRLRNRYVLALFGAAWGFLFGWLMNVYVLVSFASGGSMGSVWSAIAASSLFDALHAASNALLLILFGNSWITLLERFKRKYGLT